MKRDKNIACSPALLFSLLLLLLVPGLQAQTSSPSEQPPEARENQRVLLLQFVGTVQSLGIIPNESSKLFWWEAPGEVGPLVVQAIVIGSAAEKAGLLPGDVIKEVRGIPHFQIENALQDIAVKGGAAQVGREIVTARDSGLEHVILHIDRNGILIDNTLDIR
ncbi:MAG TPA: PDZ domain-containing protein [Thermoanaerobaculia bacterium]|jgi:membrane-associated protease RseP (regulator of RpoE activity)|nr:PDZ domain-containing protein [Thermoanaerobaculia bacterium]